MGNHTHRHMHAIKKHTKPKKGEKNRINSTQSPTVQLQLRGVFLGYQPPQSFDANIRCHVEKVYTCSCVRMCVVCVCVCVCVCMCVCVCECDIQLQLRGVSSDNISPDNHLLRCEHHRYSKHQNSVPLVIEIQAVDFKRVKCCGFGQISCAQGRTDYIDGD